MGYPEDRKRSTLPDSDEMPVSLQRQIDALKHDLDAATNTMTAISKAQRERIDGLEKRFDYGVGAYHNHERLKELEKKTQELDDSNHKLLNEIRELNGAACDAHTLALEVQGELSALRKRVEGLEKRLDNAGTWHSNLVKRVDGLEDDRAEWAKDAVKAGAHLKFQKLETRINEAFRRIGNTAGDVTKLLEPIRKEIETINYHLSYREVEDTNRMNELERRLDGFTGHFERKTDGVQFSNQAITGRLNGLEKEIETIKADYKAQQTQLTSLEVDVPGHLASDFDYFKKRVNELQRSVELLEQDHCAYAELEKKIDACWAGQEEVTLRVANYTNALEMAVEAGDVLLEKKIDACRVALHNTEKQLYEHALRLAGLDNLCKVHPKDPWKERWDALKAQFKPNQLDELLERVTFKRLIQIMEEME